MTWELSLAGLLIGLLVGATGMGGGALMTPLLIFLFGFKPTLAVGTDILHGAVFKTFGAVLARGACRRQSGSSRATATRSSPPLGISAARRLTTRAGARPVAYGRGAR